MSRSLTPEKNDTSVAMRTASLVVFAAAAWFFVSPWTYYGVSNQSSAWNCWIVGAVMLAISAARLLRPLYSTSLSWINTALGVWVFASAWIFGQSGNSERFVNSLCVGAVIVGLSIASVKNTRGSGVPEF